MAPLDFEEFLWAMGHDQLVDEIRSSFEIMGPLAPSLHEKALGLYRQYLVVGGMPEAVQTYIDDQSIIDVAEKHRIILDGYSADTNKYADERLSAKTRACFDSIPQQLAKENRKFQIQGSASGGQCVSLWRCSRLACIVGYGGALQPSRADRKPLRGPSLTLSAFKNLSGGYRAAGLQGRCSTRRYSCRYRRHIHGCTYRKLRCPTAFSHGLSTALLGAR